MTHAPPTGIILAGGLSRRMGGRDKAFLPLAGRTLIEHVRDRLVPQVARLLINAPDSPDYRALGCPLIADARPGNLGPLAGIEAVMLALPDPWFVTVAVDLPFLPVDLAARLQNSAKTSLTAAASDGRLHPVVGLWSRSLLPLLTRALDQERRDLHGFHRACQGGVAEFPVPADGLDPFFNINAPGDLTRAGTWLQGVAR